MRDFQDKVAVVTGAASGIGRAMAECFARAGMKVVLADIEEAALTQASDELGAQGFDNLAIRTDVGREEEVRALADKTLDEFGAVDVLCNNAGVFSAGLAWQTPRQDYQWLMDVNVWGVIHGVRVFVPIMLGQDSPAHIVNTASMAGVTNGPMTAVYYMTKHAVVGYSEALYHDLTSTGSRIGVSVLCPELIDTRIGEARRNRPRDLAGFDFTSPERELVETTLRTLAPTTGIAPAVIAERVLQAIRDEKFYILSDDGWRRSCEVRLEDIRLGRNPTLSIPAEAVGAEGDDT